MRGTRKECNVFQRTNYTFADLFLFREEISSLPSDGDNGTLKKYGLEGKFKIMEIYEY